MNKTCYLVKTQTLPVFTVASSVDVDKFSRIQPLARSFIHGLKTTPGIYIRGDEIFGEDVLQRLREEGGRVDVWLEAYVFSNKSLVRHIAERAKGLDIGLIIYYINATDPGPWPGRERAIEMMRSWVNEYTKHICIIHSHRVYPLAPHVEDRPSAVATTSAYSPPTSFNQPIDQDVIPCYVKIVNDEVCIVTTPKSEF
ncbi:MAG: hypothetical protein QW680_10910 [Pyrobaculum sp.]|uniref:hypothetical protein n=1 Tax=Pyrobaculum aerophilum TaxID=13773 RepID=UPI002FDA406D